MSGGRDRRGGGGGSGMRRGNERRRGSGVLVLLCLAALAPQHVTGARWQKTLRTTASSSNSHSANNATSDAVHAGDAHPSTNTKDTPDARWEQRHDVSAASAASASRGGEDDAAVAGTLSEHGTHSPSTLSLRGEGALYSSSRGGNATVVTPEEDESGGNSAYWDTDGVASTTSAERSGDGGRGRGRDGRAVFGSVAGEVEDENSVGPGEAEVGLVSSTQPAHSIILLRRIRSRRCFCFTPRHQCLQP